MPQGHEISFVVFPDGKVDERSLCVTGKRHARQRCIAAWLPEEYFGRNSIDYIADQVWRDMQQKGFKAYTIQIGEDGQPILDQD